jgi:hypothetical protein
MLPQTRASVTMPVFALAKSPMAAIAGSNLRQVVAQS